MEEEGEEEEEEEEEEYLRASAGRDWLRRKPAAG